MFVFRREESSLLSQLVGLTHDITIASPTQLKHAQTPGSTFFACKQHRQISVHVIKFNALFAQKDTGANTQLQNFQTRKVSSTRPYRSQLCRAP